ncbi:nuclease A inhibitor family protein [Brunnivagina elsteri]|uniref:Nuclease n=1 Tax=Brunnivagina elsteri CCALA 953 TaxID=987040 RepID=A0A2A2TN56_9CYAN|nr:nuclease A inhibitor family protein [Calothrix elsteri]PAX59784.1 nuclease [Calothrix elsteri CCALA 953]
MTNKEITDQLKAASEGLIWMSESEYPFEFFLWEGAALLTHEEVIQKTSHSSDTPIETVTVDNFFSVATTEEDWHGDEEKGMVAKFKALVQTIKLNLANSTVYRLGKIEIDVYIIGETPTGDLAGLSTKIVET